MDAKPHSKSYTLDVPDLDTSVTRAGICLPEGLMLARLDEVLEHQLPQKLKEGVDAWSSLDVDYEPPRVERLYCDIELKDGTEARLNIHRIHPCELGQALDHQHPWASAGFVWEGVFESAKKRGRFNGDVDLSDVPRRVIDVSKDGCSKSEMNHEFDVHFVRPLDAPILTVFLMVRVPGWEVAGPKPLRRLHPLDEAAKSELFASAQKRFL